MDEEKHLFQGEMSIWGNSILCLKRQIYVLGNGEGMGRDETGRSVMWKIEESLEWGYVKGEGQKRSRNLERMDKK